MDALTHLVVFDIDGTLVDSMGFDGPLYASLLREMVGCEVDEDWSTFPHVTDAGLLEECLKRCGIVDGDGSLRRTFKKRFAASIRDYIATHPSEVREAPGARVAFDALRSEPGLRVAIATGGWRETALLKLRAAGFEVGDTPIATSSEHFDRTVIMQLAQRHACADAPPSRRTSLRRWRVGPAGVSQAGM